jgi:hypothetical protein
MANDSSIKPGLFHPAPLDATIRIYPAFFLQDINSSLIAM